MALKIKKKKYKQSEVEYEIQIRINVTLWAFAYEFKNESLVDDATFDRVCEEIDVDFPTGHAVLDKWFKEEFDPCTGQWIHKHPELNKVEMLYNRLYIEGPKKAKLIQEREKFLDMHR